MEVECNIKRIGSDGDEDSIKEIKLVQGRPFPSPYQWYNYPHHCTIIYTYMVYVYRAGHVPIYIDSSSAAEYN